MPSCASLRVPSQGPFGNDINPELAIHKDLAWLTVGVLERRHYGVAFHSNVGGFWFAARFTALRRPVCHRIPPRKPARTGLGLEPSV